MSWSYDVTQLATSLLYQCRFLLGDTNTNDQRFQDEEVNFTLSIEGNVWKSAALLCEQAMAKYANLVNKSVGDLHINYSDRFKQYQALRAYLMTRSSQRFLEVYAGGISRSDKEIDRQNLDNVQPEFTKNQFNFPPGGPANGNNYSDRFLI